MEVTSKVCRSATLTSEEKVIHAPVRHPLNWWWCYTGEFWMCAWPGKDVLIHTFEWSLRNGA